MRDVGHLLHKKHNDHKCASRSTYSLGLDGDLLGTIVFSSLGWKVLRVMLDDEVAFRQESDCEAAAAETEHTTASARMHEMASSVYGEQCQCGGEDASTTS